MVMLIILRYICIMKTNNTQTKKLSMIEATVNTLIGLVVSFVIQIIMYPLLGIPVTINQSLLLTGVFFVASVIRGYFVRRLFNNKNK